MRQKNSPLSEATLFECLTLGVAAFSICLTTDRLDFTTELPKFVNGGHSELSVIRFGLDRDLELDGWSGLR